MQRISTSMPQPVFVTTTDASVRSTTASANIAPNQLSATFSVTMVLDFAIDSSGFAVVDFAPVTRSATFSPQG